MSVKSLIVSFFAAFTKPGISFVKDPSIQESEEGSCKLTSRTLVQKINEAKLVQAEVHEFLEKKMIEQMQNYVKQPMESWKWMDRTRLTNGWRIRE